MFAAARTTLAAVPPELLRTAHARPWFSVNPPAPLLAPPCDHDSHAPR